jgi:polyisoprenoid-binding protein YceI
MANYLTYLFLFIFSGNLFAQKFSTASGTLRFVSETPLETIRAENKQVRAALNLTDGQAAVVVQIRGFQFPKALMQEHFNDNYMESNRFPRATFEGKITNPQMLLKPGEHTTDLAGTLHIHGVDKAFSARPTFRSTGNTLNLAFTFPVNLNEFNIRNDKPKFIANVILVEVDFLLELP